MSHETNDIAITFGKMNPPTLGHHALGMAVMDYANKRGMSHTIFASKRHLKPTKSVIAYEGTPLSPENKLQHLQRYFGKDANVQLHISPYHAIDELLEKGHTRVHVMLGSDRIDDAGPGLKEKYGDRVEIVPFGEKREKGGTGIKAVSSTIMREHARNNNFAKFKELVPPHVPEEHSRELFDDVRKGLKLAKIKLDEEVTAQTRMKLSRIAKRTSRRRAMLRKARRRRKKGLKVMKNRAKQDVKNQFRHRYFKGKWSKLGFSTRANIDRNVNKRKKVADSMIRRILPDVIKGENQRLRNLTRRESYDIDDTDIIMEAAKSIDVRNGATRRKQKQRTKESQESSQGNVHGKYAVVTSNSGKYAGRKMVVNKNSFNPQTMDVVVSPDKFDFADGQRILDDKEFIQTDSSVELYGPVKGEESASLRRAKGNSKAAESAGFKDVKKEKSRQEKARESIMPKEPGEFDFVPGTIQAKKKQGKNSIDFTSHSAQDVEMGMAVMGNVNSGISPEEQVKRGLVSEGDMMKVLRNPHASYLPSIQKMGKKLTERYGAGVTFKAVGRTMEGVALSKDAKKYGIVDKTPKTDIMVMDSKSGKVVDLLSVKCGESQASSGNWQDNYAGLMWSVDTAKEMGIKVTKGEQKALEEFAEFLSSKEFIGSLTTQGGPSGLYTSTGPLAGKDPQILAKQKAAQKATGIAQEFGKKGGSLAALYAWTMMGGYHKFEEGSKAIPNKILAVSHDGSQMKISDLNYKLAEKLAPTLKTAARFKGGAAASVQIQEEHDKAKEQAKKEGRTLSDLEDKRPYRIRIAVRTIIPEPNFKDLVENIIPLTHMSGMAMFNLLVEQENEEKDPTIEENPEKITQALEELKQLAEQDPLELYKILAIFFDNQDLSPNINWVDLLPNEGSRINQVFINGREHRVVVQEPFNYPTPEDEVSPLGEEYLEEKRNYRKEYDNYHSSPEQRKNRGKRVAARRLMIKLGRAHKGDGKDVDHKDSNPKNNSESNLRVRSKSANRADND